MSEDNRPFWRLSKLEQKLSLEDEIGQFLTTDRVELTNSEKYLLAEALGHLYTGRYELACVSMDDVYHASAEIARYREICEVGKSVKRQALVRVLRYIKGTPSQEYPTFV